MKRFWIILLIIILVSTFRLNIYDYDFGKYFDRETEKQSYLMNIRKDLNLNPSKRDYTIEEVEKIIVEDNKAVGIVLDDETVIKGEYIVNSGNVLLPLPERTGVSM